jgi:hypothetical protein
LSRISNAVVLITSTLIAAGTCRAADLTKAAVTAFDRYIEATEAKLEPRFRGERFLGVRDRQEWRQQLRRGTPIVEPAQTNGVIGVSGGLIQHWNGAVFVPNTTLKRALAIVQDYEHHKDIYKPDVAEAKLRSRTGDNFEVYMRIVKNKLLLSDVLDTEQEIRFTTLDAHRVYSRASSRRIAEVANAGKKGEHELPVGQDRGYLWRLYGYWFFEESDGGVYISCESITLTRDIPFLMEKILGPIIREFPGESLRKSLEQTRLAVSGIAPGHQ